MVLLLSVPQESIVGARQSSFNEVWCLWMRIILSIFQFLRISCSKREREKSSGPIPLDCSFHYFICTCLSVKISCCLLGGRGWIFWKVTLHSGLVRVILGKNRFWTGLHIVCCWEQNGNRVSVDWQDISKPSFHLLCWYSNQPIYCLNAILLWSFANVIPGGFWSIITSVQGCY